MAHIILGGIEGGATHSKLVLYNGIGEKLVQVAGPGTNHWILGMEECQKRINNMVEQAKYEAKLPLQKPLNALGMSLSGCEQEETNRQLKEELQKNFPQLSSSYVVCSDTVGSIAAALENGGFVLIAGTGSNCLLLNPDNSVHRCGGWGHIMGDEGSAWWISHKAIKICFDEQDSFAQSPHSTQVVWNTVQEHFEITTRFDLLEHCYTKFDKCHFAGLCKRLSEAAVQGDQLSQWLFSEAGRVLARHVAALFPQVDSKLLSEPGGLPVLCVGSVWYSWDLLKPGFVAELKEAAPELKRLCLLRLATSIATGAVYLAAKEINFDLPRNYTKNHEIFFTYDHDDT
ncbi:hypothetical protein Cfor_12855 [Coptotermes formosanus]|uniref:N-acetyl-D-glucosamine kinase n=1 Tax=Coptotermes formosanus TaxID=36987 RepID=A0A6L2PIM8_COPFO|nr:hypothetical protein Cfor_12855 [Coptotermes formosanus]